MRSPVKVLTADPATTPRVENGPEKVVVVSGVPH
jgi:hypothetical protein